ncbi:MAG: GNAT family N-acetyltransferase [Anaerolineaceae bacterium]|nr:GNAT family N-acetyltransferase [Anaerolineaceae bacterium]
MKKFLLETNRLRIRKFSLSDAADLFEYLSLPETYLFEPGEPVDMEQAQAMCRERASGNNFFAVELITEHKMIGHLYFQQSQPLEFMTWELGYIFNPKYQGKGYCTEAVNKIIEYAFTVLNAHKVTAFCNPLNEASWRVLEKCGLNREGHFKEKAFFRKDALGNPLWHDCYAYGIIENDFQ